jgi:hypothetical protein
MRAIMSKPKFKVDDPVMVVRHPDGRERASHERRASIVVRVHRTPNRPGTLWPGKWVVLAHHDHQSFLGPEDHFEPLGI